MGGVGGHRLDAPLPEPDYIEMDDVSAKIAAELRTPREERTQAMLARVLWVGVAHTRRLTISVAAGNAPLLPHPKRADTSA